MFGVLSSIAQRLMGQPQGVSAGPNTTGFLSGAAGAAGSSSNLASGLQSVISRLERSLGNLERAVDRLNANFAKSAGTSGIAAGGVGGGGGAGGGPAPGGGGRGGGGGMGVGGALAAVGAVANALGDTAAAYNNTSAANMIRFGGSQTRAGVDAALSSVPLLGQVYGGLRNLGENTIYRSGVSVAKSYDALQGARGMRAGLQASIMGGAQSALEADVAQRSLAIDSLENQLLANGMTKSEVTNAVGDIRLQVSQYQKAQEFRLGRSFDEAASTARFSANARAGGFTPVVNSQIEQRRALATAENRGALAQGLLSAGASKSELDEAMRNRNDENFRFKGDSLRSKQMNAMLAEYRGSEKVANAANTYAKQERAFAFQSQMAATSDAARASVALNVAQTGTERAAVESDLAQRNLSREAAANLRTMDATEKEKYRPVLAAQFQAIEAQRQLAVRMSGQGVGVMTSGEVAMGSDNRTAEELAAIGDKMIPKEMFSAKVDALIAASKGPPVAQ